MLYQLALHPEIQASAYDEICNVLPQRDMPLEMTNINNLKYLKACIKETLRFVKTEWINPHCFAIKLALFTQRLIFTITIINVIYIFVSFRMYPAVIGNGRCTTSDIIISGYHIPKGVREKAFTNINL